MGFSHIDSSGSIRMVDVSGKPVVKRTAVASGAVYMDRKTIELLKNGLMKKGDPIACARVAGIMGAKKTAELIPLCHLLPVDSIDLNFEIGEEKIGIEATVINTAKTGVEMEALTAVSVAALAIYDMCKAVDKSMTIGDITLISKKKESV